MTEKNSSGTHQAKAVKEILMSEYNDYCKDQSKAVMNDLVNKINEDIKKAAEYALENNVNIEDYYIGSLEDWTPSSYWVASNDCWQSGDWLQSDC